MSTTDNMHVIVAPFFGDEIIGCFDILNNPKNHCLIMYIDDLDKKRKDETKSLRDVFPSVKGQIYLAQVPDNILDQNPIIHYPDPIFETNPIHRLQGNIGEQLLRYRAANVSFYSINMTAPYIYTLNNFEEKKKALNSVYMSLKHRWKFEHKKYSFEGHCTWQMSHKWTGQDISKYTGDGKSSKDDFKPVNEVESEIVIPEVVE